MSTVLLGILWFGGFSAALLWPVFAVRKMLDGDDDGR